MNKLRRQQRCAAGKLARRGDAKATNQQAHQINDNDMRSQGLDSE
jgi:hypothetical protein